MTGMMQGWIFPQVARVPLPARSEESDARHRPRGGPQVFIADPILRPAHGTKPQQEIAH